ncbi:hypothetical protein C8F04DRAFT_1183415 [Mycena alexandri]|uniref:Uncharacterized protein n=1 Tax=Mycena alexandri TaxID=1745969 RepID=A0AAD6SU54_9AGAR|nr:hypothetical protein C8F04DRAFT_1183415 [Mycena alexandri]
MVRASEDVRPPEKRAATGMKLSLVGIFGHRELELLAKGIYRLVYLWLRERGPTLVSCQSNTGELEIPSPASGYDDFEQKALASSTRTASGQQLKFTVNEEGKKDYPENQESVVAQRVKFRQEKGKPKGPDRAATADDGYLFLRNLGAHSSGPSGAAGRDELPALRVTNLSEDTQENDLRELSGIFWRVARVFVGPRDGRGEGVCVCEL